MVGVRLGVVNEDGDKMRCARRRSNVSLSRGGWGLCRVDNLVGQVGSDRIGRENGPVNNTAYVTVTPDSTVNPTA